MSDEKRCDARHTIKLWPNEPGSRSTRTTKCQRLAGHIGQHSDENGEYWYDTTPDTQGTTGDTK